MKPVALPAEEAAPYITLDASSIVEIFHPDRLEGLPCSLAEAAVPPGGSTIPHVHRATHEIYYFLEGSGTLHSGDSVLPARPGGAILLPPDTPHHVVAGEEGLRFLCFCTPGYRHETTVLLEGTADKEVLKCLERS